MGEAYLARKRGRIPKNEAHFTYTFGVELTILRFRLQYNSVEQADLHFLSRDQKFQKLMFFEINI